MINYLQWVFHREQLVPSLPTRREEHNMNSGDCNDIHDLLHDNLLASQVHQVFYTEDLKEKPEQVVTRVPPRDLYSIPEADVNHELGLFPISNEPKNVLDDSEDTWVRDRSLQQSSMKIEIMQLSHVILCNVYSYIWLMFIYI